MDTQLTTEEMLGISIAVIVGILLLTAGIAWCVCPVECKFVFNLTPHTKPVEIRKPIILGEVVVNNPIIVKQEKHLQDQPKKHTSYRKEFSVPPMLID